MCPARTTRTGSRGQSQSTKPTPSPTTDLYRIFRQADLTLNRYLYNFLEMFSSLGHGTPESPGGDFSMYCWIEASSKDEALNWGHVLLGDYYKHRFAHSDDASHHSGQSIERGEILTDEEAIHELKNNYTIPECRVGEFPVWDRPWRISNLNRKDASA